MPLYINPVMYFIQKHPLAYLIQTYILNTAFRAVSIRKCIQENHTNSFTCK